MKLPVVNVLMSTYNGERYIESQLDSILNQKNVIVKIHIRDDGSEDSTFSICSRYAQKYPDIKLCKGENVGVFSSFMGMLRGADNSAEYFAFCDQDDIWLEDKLSRAADFLEKENSDEPELYFSRYYISNENMTRKKMSRLYSSISFTNALVENLAPGCTMVMNKTAIKLLSERIPEGLILHDWWCFLVVCATGKVFYDPEPSMIYRLHGANASYGQGGIIEKTVKRARRLSEKSIFCFSQALKLKDNYADILTKDKIEDLDEFISIQHSSIAARLGLLFKNRFNRQTVIDEMLLRIFFLISGKGFL